MKDEVSAYSFLHVLNDFHPSISFTMELPTENTLPFLGMVLRKDSQNITTSVYVKPTNTGLLLHYNSHVDNRYKKSLIIIMLDRSFKLLSNWSLFHEECIRLKTLFLLLAYPEHLIFTLWSPILLHRQTNTSNYTQIYTWPAIVNSYLIWNTFFYHKCVANLSLVPILKPFWRGLVKLFETFTPPSKWRSNKILEIIRGKNIRHSNPSQNDTVYCCLFNRKNL